jgi:acetoin utilization deacetylase AcuC-like enzyme
VPCNGAAGATGALTVIVIHSARYHIDIGRHVFPTTKYGLVREWLIEKALQSIEFVESNAASWEDLALVHTAEYLRKLQTGTFSVEELAQLEVPWAPEVVDGFRWMTGGTIQAAHSVFATHSGGITCHLGGGLHHAFANHGEGFCLFNDVAVAIRVLFRDALASTAAVIDLDVHHGNGTAFIFETDPRVFTFSMHQQHNYPMHKPRGTLDIGLADGTKDDEYLERLAGGLQQVFARPAGVAFYLAGADPFEDDQLGGLALTKSGLRRRDRMVLDACRSHETPTVVVLAGGYARRLADTVEIHATTVEEAWRLSHLH